MSLSPSPSTTRHKAFWRSEDHKGGRRSNGHRGSDKARLGSASAARRSTRIQTVVEAAHAELENARRPRPSAWTAGFRGYIRTSVAPNSKPKTCCLELRHASSFCSDRQVKPFICDAHRQARGGSDRRRIANAPASPWSPSPKQNACRNPRLGGRSLCPSAHLIEDAPLF